MTGTAIARKGAVEVAEGTAGILPPPGTAAVVEHLLSGMTQQELKAPSPEMQGKLPQALGGTEAAPSSTQSRAVSKIKCIGGYKAVVGQISVKGQQLDTLLSEGSFCKSRADQTAYAEKLGYRMATRAEHRAYVDSLLAKEEDKSINAAEAHALRTYRERYVRDTHGALVVDGRRVNGRSRYWQDFGYPFSGALFVRASAESK